MIVVSRTPTPISQAALPGLVEQGFQAEGKPLAGMQRMMLAVLVALETGRGRAMMNHNAGNITAGPSYAGAIWRPPWYDPNEARGNPKLEALHQRMLAGKAPSAFRAYGSREEGARDFARQLSHSFPEVLRAAAVTNAANFRAALAVRYSKDYSPAHDATIRRLMSEFGITETGGSALGSGAVALLLLALAWRLLR